MRMHKNMAKSLVLAAALVCYAAAVPAADVSADTAQQRFLKYSEAAPSGGAIVSVPEQYIISQAPPGMRIAKPLGNSSAEKSQQAVEKPESVNGELYTVIAPIYLGGGPDGGNVSYIRFYNRETHATTFTVSIVGYKTDSLVDSRSTVLGTAIITVPKNAAPQYSVGQIVDAAGIGAVACPTTCPSNVYQGVALYIRSPDEDVGYQHIMYSVLSGFFENMTICADESLSDGTGNRYMSSAVALHTSVIGAMGYPASVAVHNYSSSNGTYTFFINDADTGNTVGRVDTTLLANTTYVLPMAWIEQQAHWTPLSSQVRANILGFKLINNGTDVMLTDLVMGGLIYNQRLLAYINVSSVCRVLH